tara:strand:- start:355 stop:738 length:384 start_codon:yes stop_codon:yes gene_type:complete
MINESGSLGIRSEVHCKKVFPESYNKKIKEGSKNCDFDNNPIYTNISERPEIEKKYIGSNKVGNTHDIENQFNHTVCSIKSESNSSELIIFREDKQCLYLTYKQWCLFTMLLSSGAVLTACLIYIKK